MSTALVAAAGTPLSRYYLSSAHNCSDHTLKMRCIYILNSIPSISNEG